MECFKIIARGGGGCQDSSRWMIMDTWGEMHHLIGGRSRFFLPDGYMMETSMKISKLEDEKASGRMEEDEINMRYTDQDTKQLPGSNI